MKPLLFVILSALGAAPAPPSAPPAPADKAPANKASVKAQDVTLDQAVDGVQRFYEQVTDFRATFRQEVKRNGLPRKRVHRGKVFFKKPGMMRWDYTQPERVLYVSDGEVLWSYQPEDRLVYKMGVRDSELYNALKFLFGQGNLRNEFDAKLLPADAKDNLVRLALTPKHKQSNYKRLVLAVDPARFEIRQTELVDPLGNVSRVRFSDLSYEPLKASGFHFTPPKGVQVQDLQTPSARPLPKAPSTP